MDGNELKMTLGQKMFWWAVVIWYCILMWIMTVALGRLVWRAIAGQQGL